MADPLKYLEQESSDDKRVAQVKELYQEHHQRLIHRVMAKGLQQREAEDIVQEAFVRLLGLENDEINSYIKAYLYRIALNLAVDKLRYNARSPIQEMPEQEQFTDESTSPERKNESQQLLNKMVESIKTLPLKCRQAFILYKLKGMAYADIAVTLQVSESMVRKYVLRAVRHCFDELKSDL
jgi:RNA polymerase sigma-70 factor (ECF subfamily)